MFAGSFSRIAKELPGVARLGRGVVVVAVLGLR
jgi:hypothetical protein